MSQNMIEELEQYYTDQEISANDFNCKHYEVCKGKCKTFSKAKEAMVGSEYEKHTLPRILFISLDPGCSSRYAEKRTTEFQRMSEIVEKESDLGGGGKHWKETCLLAHRILQRYKRDLKITDIQAYFAHTNSAKCCENNDGNGQAHHRLFENCREYLRSEIEILNPDVIITQGDQSWNAVTHGLKEQEYAPNGKIHICSRDIMKNAYFDNGILHMNNKEVLWFHFHHTGNAGYFWDQKKICHEYWTEKIIGHLQGCFDCEV